MSSLETLLLHAEKVIDDYARGDLSDTRFAVHSMAEAVEDIRTTQGEQGDVQAKDETVHDGTRAG